ncbi:MAG: hypothetical protein AB8B65_18775 [Kordia sp.]|uniref:hypothetical protein n=1 Tax=Kordia sp. TaxID=1965332 RepID=UPI00385EAA24
MLLIIGGFVAIALFMRVPETIEKFKDTSKIEAENPNAYLIGIVIAGVILLTIAIVAIYYGVQMFTRANKEVKNLPKEKAVKK